MTAGPMRRHFSSSTRARLPLRPPSTYVTAPPFLGLRQYQRTIADTRPRQASVSRSWFTSTTACPHPESGGPDRQPPDERTLKLGKTIRILHDHLPTLLASPLPQDILSPHISLHLFPSTHPHLPTVSGKLAYTAALWTAPVAWGRVPLVGNVKLTVLSERMIKNGGISEKLIVKWKTCAKSEETPSDAMEKITEIVSRSKDKDDEFSGLFIFEFDEEGRILSHTIEHAEQNGNFDRTAKVISVTDWLLGRAWGRRAQDGGEGTPGLAFIQSDRLKGAQGERKDGQ